MSTYRNILVATESLNSPVEKVDFVKALAANNGAKLNLLHTMTALTQSSLAYSLPSLLSIEDNLIANAKNELAKVGERLGVDRDKQSVMMGQPADSILAYANKIKADLIIVCNEKKHLFGSTVESILHHANCDVLAVRS